MNRQEALDYIQSTSWLGMKPGLERIEELMTRLGHPEKDLTFIHVAGTNGKGSTATMLEAIYRAGGYKTGLFTSPHLSRFNERFKLNGQDMSDEDFCRIATKVQEAARGMADPPTEFEITTAMALVFFAEAGAKPVILEVGLGGEMDSTNVIPAPLAAVICRLGLDHTAILGDTIQEIAQAKAGIIKKGSRCFAYPSQKEALEVLKTRCQAQGVPLQVADPSRIQLKSHDLTGQVFDWQGRGERLEDLRLPLLGAYQLDNVALVLEIAEGLSGGQFAPAAGSGETELAAGAAQPAASASAPLPLSQAAVRQGLASVVWPARFEILRHAPLFIVDGSHNPQGAEALSQLLQDYLPGRQLTFLMGIMADKDVGDYLDCLLPYARRVICVRPDNPRALDPELLAQKIQAKGVPAQAAATVEAGVDQALAAGDALAVGSFYMAGAIREHVLKRLGSGD